MSDHYLVVDGARRVYVDCDKFFPHFEENVHGVVAVPFERFASDMNMGDAFAEKSNRYVLDERDMRALFDFCVESKWKIRLASLDSSDYVRLMREYEALPLYQGRGVRAECSRCGNVRWLLGANGACNPCQWADFKNPLQA